MRNQRLDNIHAWILLFAVFLQLLTIAVFGLIACASEPHANGVSAAHITHYCEVRCILLSIAIWVLYGIMYYVCHVIDKYIQ